MLGSLLHGSGTYFKHVNVGLSARFGFQVAPALISSLNSDDLGGATGPV